MKQNRDTGISQQSGNSSAVFRANSHLLEKKKKAQNRNDLVACKDDCSFFNDSDK